MRSNEPVLEPTAHHAIIGEGEDLYIVDLGTMTKTLLARDAWGPPAFSHHSSRYAYVDHDHNVHLIEFDGKPIKTIESATRPNNLVLSATGDRLGIVGDSEMIVYDGKGNRLGAFPIERDQSVFLLRGDDVWTGGNEGVLRRYRDGTLVASIPTHATEIQDAALARDAIVLLGSDATLVIARSNASQVVTDEEPCPHPTYTSNGIATGYECGGHVKVFAGRESIADYPTSDLELSVAYDRTSGRAAVSGDDGIHVFDHGKPIAKASRRGPSAFEDADHLWVAEPSHELLRWTISADRWEKVLPVGDVYAVATLRGKVLLGTREGQLVVVENGREARRVEVGEQVGDIVPSWDGRWVAVNLATGATAIVDAQTWQIARKLPPADNFGSAPTFDASGDLLLRASRNALAIWDRATGEELVFGLDLLQDLSNGRFLADGRIELDRREPGLLDIPRDTRPIAQILRDIDCKVPLVVVGSRIEPRTPRCP